MRIWIDPVKLAARGLSASDLAAALRANNVQSAPGQIKGKNTAINITAATDFRGMVDFRNRVVKSTSGGQVGLGVSARMDGRRVGQGGVGRSRSGWWPNPSNKIETEYLRIGQHNTKTRHVL